MMQIHKVIPISFNVKELLTEHCHRCPEIYNIQTKSVAKQVGVPVPKIFGAYKQLVPEVEPEHK